MVRPMVQDMFDALMMDMPLRPAMIIDFGVIENGSVHHSALQRAVRAGATAEELDEALGDGPKITVLVQKYTDCMLFFQTPYDLM